MKTELPDALLASDAGREAYGILRSCVHCGFCLATCPTYQLLGDERDSPRGRIYLIKSVLESGDAAGEAQAAQPHLDRCLTCRACEVTCPSGVAYGRLLEIGRDRIEHVARRPLAERMLRFVLRTFVPRRRLFEALVWVGGLLRPLLPGPLARHVPRRRAGRREPLPAAHPRRVLLLGGCVQAAVTPDVNRALTVLLDRIGVTAVTVRGEVCCGALPLHLGYEEEARQFARRNVDALWPHMLAGAERIVSTASGCGVTVRDYAHLLARDPEYAERAARIAEATVDVAEFLAGETIETPRPAGARVAWHPPCTLQHGLRVTSVVERLLEAAGYELVPVADQHLCCGSAGTYSILQPELADALRTRKLENLEAHEPDLIATANIGCEVHLAHGAKVPVLHWLELIERASRPEQGGGER